MSRLNPSTWYFPTRSSILLLLGIFTLIFLVDYTKSFQHELRSVHIWRQADCLSFVQNFYQQGNGFFEPEVHNLGLTKTSKTTSDFPLIYYGIAQVWKIAGKSVPLYRGFIFGLFVLALLALHDITEYYLKSTVFSLLLIGLWMTSPVLLYYSNNYLMNMPALCSSILGWHSIFSWSKNGKYGSYLLGLSLFFLAALFKVTALINAGALGVLLLGKLLFDKYQPTRSEITRLSLPFLFGILIIVSWVSYAVHYNSNYEYGMFLTGILPIWELNSDQIKEIFQGLWASRRDYQATPFLYVCWGLGIPLLVYSILKIRKSEWVPRLVLTFMLGFVAYFLLFFQVLHIHDYYLTHWIILFFLIPFSTIYLLRSKLKHPVLAWGLTAVLVFLLVDSALNLNRRYADRFNEKDWKNHYYLNTLSDYEGISDHLNKLNIPSDAVLYSPSDFTINATLYLADRKGWTYYNTNGEMEKVASFILSDADYVMVHQSTLDQDMELAHLLQELNPLQAYNQVLLFQVKP